VQAVLARYLAIDEGNPAWQALAALALLNHVGWSADVEGESETLFGAFGLDTATARRHVEALHDRFGIAPMAGRFRYVSPELLADHLAARQIRTWTQAKMRDVLSAIGPHLAKRFARRLRRLSGVLRGRSSVEQVIFEDSGPLRAIAELEGNPLPALLALERLIDPATDEQLRLATQTRRDLVGALESLLWREEMFERAATLLLRLSIAENEPSIGNNATGVFVETFQTQLGHTAAGPRARLRVLRVAAGHSNPAARVLAAKALGAAMRTGLISRFGMPPRDVDEMPEEAWRPATYDEWFDVVRRALAILGPLLTDTDYMVREAAVKSLADAVPNAVIFPVTAEWLAAAERLVDAPYDLRAPALNAILWEIRWRRLRDQVGEEVDIILGIARDAAELSEMDEEAFEPGTAEAAIAQHGEEAIAPPSPDAQHEFHERVLKMARFAVRLRGDDFSSRLRRAVTRDAYAVGVHGNEAEMRRVQEEIERLAAEGLASPELIEAAWPWMVETHRAYASQWADVLGAGRSRPDSCSWS
jgi:hypothetical protein